MGVMSRQPSASSVESAESAEIGPKNRFYWRATLTGCDESKELSVPANRFSRAEPVLARM